MWLSSLVYLLPPAYMPSYGLHVYITLVSAVPLGVGRWGSFSSHSVYKSFLERLASAHWIYFSSIRCSPTPWMFFFTGISVVSDLYSVLGDTLFGVLFRVQYIWRFLSVL